MHESEIARYIIGLIKADTRTVTESNNWVGNRFIVVDSIFEKASFELISEEGERFSVTVKKLV